jgi:hypothetical protein
MIYLVAALDNPYRGKVSVTAEPLEQVYQQIMLSAGPPAVTGGACAFFDRLLDAA